MITELHCEKLIGETAFERMLALAESRENFLMEFNNYMQGGVIVNTPKMFLMAKPVDSSKEPDGQWWVEKPDAWYVRWASGEGAMKAMMNMGEPLPYIVFRRIKEGVTKPFKRYEWDTLYRRIAGRS